MTAITFDTLKLTRRLEDAGFNRKQAEAQAEALAEAMVTGIEDLATKEDIAILASKIDVMEERNKGRFSLLQWMIGFNTAVVLALLWMMFKLITA